MLYGKATDVVGRLQMLRGFVRGNRRR
jgi:hypothetical protein